MRYVKECRVFDEDDHMGTAVIRLTERMEVLSSAVLNGGHNITDTLFIMQVPHDYKDGRFMEDIVRTKERYGLPDDSVGFMTAAEVRYVFSTFESEFEGTVSFAAATAGVTNCVVAGDTLDRWEERYAISQERYRMLIGGTINIIGVSPVPLTDTAKVNILLPITEAKAAAMHDAGYNETGTTSDAVAIVSPIGEPREVYAGTGVPLGISMARAVREAVGSCIRKRGDYPYISDIVYQLERHGVMRSCIRDIVTEVSPGTDLNAFDRVLRELCQDVNIAVAVQGAFMLDELGRKDCICTLRRGEFAEGPEGLKADREIGVRLAQYISCSEDVPEFDLACNAVEGWLISGPFTKGSVCGIIGGILGRLSGPCGHMH
jgi:adenosylcobinamide hydrolase